MDAIQGLARRSRTDEYIEVVNDYLGCGCSAKGVRPTHSFPQTANFDIIVTSRQSGLAFLMATTVLTDTDIEALLKMPKRVENPGTKQRTEGKHLRRDYRVASNDSKSEFALFVRQSTVLPESFSVGLRWLPKSGEDVMLIRFNGPSHPHSNTIEGERFEFVCHVHQATERYLAAGKKDEGFAVPSGDYTTVGGALHCLAARCNISGLNTQADERDLFER